ncbi:hypothetical protein ColLi_05227 [Colletotrichum liriopes]|uniref:Uncharacterized protein n=1 Tax=Colletotrichum liriopes TaxID=708192 RepID=A0AA37LRL2_9PEZI|nr:hypothetical protein ColLi_05227 [Colletotrichum liriopes]
MYTGQEATVESEVEKNNVLKGYSFVSVPPRYSLGTAAVAPAAAGGIPPTNPPGSSIGRRRPQTESLARTAPTRRISRGTDLPSPPLTRRLAPPSASHRSTGLPPAVGAPCSRTFRTPLSETKTTEKLKLRVCS